jgi:hypothetical protein
MLEDRPPTEKDIATAEVLHEFLLNSNTSLDDAFEKLCCRASGLTLFTLRNGLGVLAARPGDTAGAAGHVWPAELPGPESLFNACCQLLRVPRGGSIPRDKFARVQRFIDFERHIAKKMPEDTLFTEVLLDAAGTRLRPLVNNFRKIGGPTSARDSLEAIDMFLEMEPRATSSLLLLKKEASVLHTVIDMVLYQGMSCIENRTILVLWNFCCKLVFQAAALGCPRAAGVRSDSKGRDSSPRCPGVVGDVVSLKMSRSASESRLSGARGGRLRSDSVNSDIQSQRRPSLGRSKTGVVGEDGPSPPKSGAGSRGASPRETGSAGGDSPGGMARVRSAGALPALPRPAPAPKDRSASMDGDSVGEMRAPVVKRKAFGKRKTVSLPELTPESGTSLPLEVEDKKAPGRRHSIGPEPLSLDQALADLSRAAANQTAADDKKKKGDPEDWELNCCALLWEVMPAQSVTYAIGVGMHSVKKSSHLLEVMKGAWQLLDKVRAVECLVGEVGTIRLRFQMDALADLFGDTLDVKLDTKEEDLKAIIEKCRLTFIRLCSLCEADKRFAQISVLYGCAFIVENMCKWSETKANADGMTKEGRALIKAMEPHLVQLFKKCTDDDPFADINSDLRGFGL